MFPYNEVALLCLDENIHMNTNIFQPSEVLLPDYREEETGCIQLQS